MGIKFSIITVCYNSEKTIRDTLESVKNQTFKNYEHIIVDGLSKDNTLKIVGEYIRDQLIIHSGKDTGIYDAMNKGIDLANGDVVCFLNSDDVFDGSEVLESIASEFDRNGETNILYGDLVYVSSDDLNKVTRIWKSGKFRKMSLHFGWHPPHPSFFVKRDLIQKIGYFDLKYSIASDYNYMMRSLQHSQADIAYLEKSLVRMREGGVSNQSITNILRANIQCFKSNREAGKIAPMAAILKPFRKIIQLRL